MTLMLLLKSGSFMGFLTWNVTYQNQHLYYMILSSPPSSLTKTAPSYGLESSDKKSLVTVMVAVF